jgi:predicted Zn-dependent protease
MKMGATKGTWRGRVRRIRTLIGAVMLSATAFTMSGCAAFLMSPEQEVELGRQVHTEVTKQMKLVSDPQIVNYVKKVGNIVVANAPEKALVPIEFYVVDNPEINAFAVPGGGIYIHTGLINAASDEAELASVLAHEYGHVAYRHVAEQVSRQNTLGVAQQILLGEESPAAAKVATDIAGHLYLQRYSRQDELEADSIAIPTLANANYDPNAIITFFSTLKERYGDQSGMVTFLASHPATGERIERVEAQIDAMPGDRGDGVRPVTELRRIQGRLQDLGMVD